MIALKLHPAPLIAVPAWERLITVTEAAQRLGKHPEHLSRLCRDTLAAQGVAFYLTPPEGGHRRWFIDRRHDVRLAETIGPLHIEPDLAGYSKAQREGALLRRACVERLRRLRRECRGSLVSAVAALVMTLRQEFPGLRISKSTLHDWDKRYQRPCDLVKLIDARGGNRRGDDDPAAWKAFADLFLHENGPHLKFCWRTVADLAKEHGWKWCSLKSCQRQLDRRIPPEQQTLHRQPAKWRSALKPSIAQDPEAWAAGECWIGDHKQCDLICRFADRLIRPWLTTWMDWRTRKVTGWVLSDSPNSTTILSALRHGLLDQSNFGGPAHVWIDNGKDYDCWLFHGQTKRQRKAKICPAVEEPRAVGLFAGLQIEPHFSIPFNPNGKSRLERWFRTLEALFKTFDTYTGDGPDTKPERLNEVLSKPLLIPEFETVYKRMAAHIDGYNSNAEHTRRDTSEAGVLLSPAEALHRWTTTRRVHAPEALNGMLQDGHRMTTVGKNGVSVCIHGKTISYGRDMIELSPFKAARKEDRRPVRVAYDPHDISRVYVYDQQGVRVCIAEANRLGGMHGTDAVSKQDVADLNRRQAKYRKAQKHVADYSLTSVLTTEEQLAEIAAEKSAARAEPVRTMKLVTTPLDKAAPPRRRQVEREPEPIEPAGPSLLERAKAAYMRPVRDESADGMADIYTRANQTLREAVNG